MTSLQQSAVHALTISDHSPISSSPTSSSFSSIPSASSFSCTSSSLQSPLPVGRSYSEQVREWLVGTAVGRDPSGIVMAFCAYRGDVEQSWKSPVSGSISSLLVLPNGDIASGCKSDRNIIIWRKGVAVKVLEGHTDLSALALLQNADIACGSYRTIKIWRDGVCTQTLDGHSSFVLCLCVLANGDLVSGSYDRSIKIWRGNLCVQTLIGHKDPVCSIVSLPNGDLASGSWDACRIWRDGACVQVLEGHTDSVRSFACRRNGDLLSGSSDKTIKLWRNGECVQSFDGHSGGVTALLLLPNEDVLSGSDDCTIRIWTCSDKSNNSNNNNSKWVCVHVIEVGVNVRCMQLVSPLLVVVGCRNGDLKTFHL